MELLPDDVIREIIMYVTDRDLATFFILNRRCKNICEDEYFWEKRRMQQYGLFLPPLLQEKSEKYKYEIVKDIKQFYLKEVHHNWWCEGLSVVKWMCDRKSINFSGENLHKISKGITYMDKLESIFLYGNKITEIPKEFCNLKSLQHISLNNNYLTEFPKEICNFQNLSILFLSNNKLVYVPMEIGKLTSLKHLDLENNNVTFLPKEIGNLIHLEKFNLSNNQLTFLPKEIKKLKKLSICYLNRNKISLGTMKKIQRLLPTCRFIKYF